ncbi:hypothetical protein ACVRAH_004976, partial [Escherichia coli]
HDKKTASRGNIAGGKYPCTFVMNGCFYIGYFLMNCVSVVNIHGGKFSGQKNPPVSSGSTASCFWWKWYGYEVLLLCMP